MPLDLEVFSAGLSDILERSLTPLWDQIRILRTELDETRAVAAQPGPRGEDGPPGPAGPIGQNAEPVTKDLILAAINPEILAEAVALHLEANPIAAGRDGSPGERGEKGERGDLGPPGAQGERGDSGEVGERGEKGERGDRGPHGEQGERGDSGEVGERGEKGIDGAPGERGEQGEKGSAGRDGRDGQPGRDGEDGVDGASGPVGKDGRDGIDGKDGLGFDDLSVLFDGARTIVLRFERGDNIKDFPIVLPITLDRGVWREGSYLRGDSVTWDGSWWIAQEDTSGKPGASSDWRLAVKRGRDGKSGKDGKDGPVGPKGDRGEIGPRGF